MTVDGVAKNAQKSWDKHGVDAGVGSWRTDFTYNPRVLLATGGDTISAVIHQFVEKPFSDGTVVYAPGTDLWAGLTAHRARRLIHGVLKGITRRTRALGGGRAPPPPTHWERGTELCTVSALEARLRIVGAIAAAAIAAAALALPAGRRPPHRRGPP